MIDKLSLSEQERFIVLSAELDLERDNHIEKLYITPLQKTYDTIM